MNIKSILLLTFTIFCFANLKNSDIKAQYFGSCQCYCSDKCGPRDSKPGDEPFYDQEFGLCFCKMRDKNNFFPHGCNLRPRPTNLNCCG